MSKMTRTGCFIYSRLLLLYPAEFRQRFGDEMLEVFERMLDEVEAGGPVDAASVWVSVAWDVLRVALPLRLQTSAVMAYAGSFVASSALTLAFFRAVS